MAVEPPRRPEAARVTEVSSHASVRSSLHQNSRAGLKPKTIGRRAILRRTGFEDHVEPRFGCSPYAAKPARADDFPELRLAGLRPECCPDFLRQRGRHTNHR